MRELVFGIHPRSRAFLELFQFWTVFNVGIAEVISLTLKEFPILGGGLCRY